MCADALRWCALLCRGPCHCVYTQPCPVPRHIVTHQGFLNHNNGDAKCNDPWSTWSEALEMKPASVCAKASTRVIAPRRPLRRAATPRAATSLPQNTTTTPSKFAAVIKHTERACAASRDRPVILGFRDDLEVTASSDLIVCSLPRFRFSPPDQLVCNSPSCNSGPYPATAETAFLPRL